MRKRNTRHAPRTTHHAHRTPSVQIHIDALVLHGFAPADRYRIADAVQIELTRLFAEQGVSAALQHGGEASRLQAAAINVTPSMRGETIGAQVARSVYGSLNPAVNHDDVKNAK